MPFYEYQCGSCGHYLEAMQKITDAPLRKCPDCGKLALKKLLSAPVFRLKGSGWYETDFKSDKEAKRNLVEERKEEDQKEAPKAAEASEAPKTEAKADAKIDSKAATMTPPKAKAKPRTGARARSKTKMARKGR
ncbi:MAG: zinc ribbon domain-containing protein [Microbacteriaceae bacterium]|nr:zinc ribbon domain-containing protein [Microbacteriaceae bacterium]